MIDARRLAAELARWTASASCRALLPWRSRIVPAVMISGHGTIETAGRPPSSTAPTTSSRSRSKSDRLLHVQSSRALEAARASRYREPPSCGCAPGHGKRRSPATARAINQALRSTVERVAPDRLAGADPAVRPAVRQGGRGTDDPRPLAPRRGARSSRSTAPRSNPSPLRGGAVRRRKPASTRCRSAPPRRRAGARPHRHAATRRGLATCRSRPRARSSAPCRTRLSSASAAHARVKVDVRVLATTNKRPAGRDRRRPLPRRPLLPPRRSAAEACRGSRSAATTYPELARHVPHAARRSPPACRRPRALRRCAHRAADPTTGPATSVSCATSWTGC